MEWDPDPDHSVFEPEGEENKLVGEVINVLDNLESGQQRPGDRLILLVRLLRTNLQRSSAS